jgi:UDP-N-acetylmuramate--alanine ligase
MWPTPWRYWLWHDELDLPIGEPWPYWVSLEVWPADLRNLAKVGVLVIDDYAHHPTEIRATLAAARHLQRRIVAVFQPHRYTRVARFAAGIRRLFLHDTDQLILTDIYPAGEKPIPGSLAEFLAEAVETAGSPSNSVYIPDYQDDIQAF